MTDIHYMKMALDLAKKGCGAVNPNPLVGAVIVKDGAVIGQGFHEKYGDFHAERNALSNCISSSADATLYVTLEPCCHHGKTPPCTKAILDSGISHVVIGTRDPNPLVSGKGINELKNNGITVTENILEDECKKINEVFFHYVTTGTPYIVMKYAMTIDGKIAAYTGESKWITGEIARNDVHNDRNKYMAVMVGVGTIISDNPLLTCRIENGINPIRIICDTTLRTPLNANVINTAMGIPTIIATASRDTTRIKEYTDRGCKIINLSLKGDHINLKELAKELGKQAIDSILLEGGAAINWAALNDGLVNKVKAYISPKILGGETAKTPVGGFGMPHPNQAFLLSNSVITNLGEDILIESEVEK